MPNRIIPKDKIEDLRFGQLLINALQQYGYLDHRKISHNVMDEEYADADMAYAVVGTDLFFVENDELETILQRFLAEHSDK